MCEAFRLKKEKDEKIFQRRKVVGGCASPVSAVFGVFKKAGLLEVGLSPLAILMDREILTPHFRNF